METNQRNLQEQNATLQRDYARAYNDLERADAKTSGFANALDSTRNQLRVAHAQLEKSEQETKRAESEAATLRSIILEGVNTQKVSDNDVKRDFSKLRQGIQKLLGNSVLSISNTPDFPADGESEDDVKAFYDTARWADLSPQDRKRRLCGKVFAILHSHILENKCFGLAGFERGADSPDIQIQITIQNSQTRFERLLDLGVIETGLQRFEKLLEERNGMNYLSDPCFGLVFSLITNIMQSPATSSKTGASQQSTAWRNATSRLRRAPPPLRRYSPS
jgi:hypothetical protein